MAHDTQSFDRDFHHIPVFQKHLRLARKSHTRGGTGRDDVPGREREHVREITDQRGDIENQVSRVGILHDPAVQPVYDPIEAMVYSASRHNVRATYIGGREVSIDATDILAEADGIAARLKANAGKKSGPDG